MSFILVQGLDRGKRVRLTDGRLTPVFEYSIQAVKYARARGMFNAVVQRSSIELDFKKKEKKA